MTFSLIDIENECEDILDEIERFESNTISLVYDPSHHKRIITMIKDLELKCDEEISDEELMESANLYISILKERMALCLLSINDSILNDSF